MRCFVAAFLLVCGCVKSESLQCSDDLTCPLDQRCDLAHDGCADEDQFAACEGLPDGTPCEAAAVESGTCDQGVCLQARCGDGVVQGLEECDGDAGEETCTSLGYYDAEGTPACGSDCRYELDRSMSGCTGYCGDGEVRLGTELCDGSDPQLACSDLGYGAGYLSCNRQTCGPLLDDCKLFGWINTEVSVPMRDVHGVADDAVFAVSETTAGMPAADYYNGIEWRAIPLTGCALAQNVSFLSVWAVGRDEAFASAFPGAIVVRLTSTGCTTLPPPPAQVRDLWAASATDIFVTSASGVHRFDGVQWNLSSSNTTRNDIWGTSASDVFAGGAQFNGTVMHFDGSSWDAPVQLTGLGQVNAIWGVSPTEVYAAGQGSPAVFRYNGSTWSGLPGGIVGTASAGTMANGRVVVGLESGAIQAYDGARWSVLNPIGGFGYVLALWTAPTSNDVYAATQGSAVLATYRGAVHIGTPLVGFDTGGDRFAVKNPSEIYVIDFDSAGEFSALRRWTGTNWSTEGGTNGLPSDVWVDPDGNVRIIEMASDNGGGAMRLRTGFSTWSLITGGVEGQRIWGVSGADYWAFAGNTTVTLRHYVNGALVTCTGCPAAMNLADLAGTSASNVFFVGSGGKIYRYNGAMVVETPSGTTESLFTVGASPDGNHVWAAGAKGTLLHWNGTAWESLQGPNGLPIRSVWGTAPDDLFVGQSGFIYYFDGTHWSPVDAEVSGSVRELEGYGDTLYYIDSGGVPSSLHAIVRTRPW